MTISERGTAQTASGVGVTSLAVNAPTGIAAGDVIVLYGRSTNTTAASIACTGFTALATEGPDAAFLYRVADGTEGSTFTVTFGTANGRIALLCGAWSGVDTTNPFDPNVPAATEAATGNSTAPSIAGLENSATEATTVNGDLLLYLVCAKGGTSGQTNQASTTPTGYTLEAQVCSTATTTVNSYVGMFSASQTAAGTAGTVSSTLTNSAQWGAQLVALRAAASGSTTATAGLASVTVASLTPTPAVTASSGNSAVTVTSPSSSVALTVTAGNSAVSVSAHTAVPVVSFSAGHANTSITALGATPLVTTLPSDANVVVAAYTPTIAGIPVTVTAGVANVAVAAYQISIVVPPRYITVSAVMGTYRWDVDLNSQRWDARVSNTRWSAQLAQTRWKAEVTRFA